MHMNIKIKKLLLSKTAKRTVSGLTALALLCGALPMSEIREGVDKFSNFIISASAAPSEPAFPYTSTDSDGNHYLTLFTNQLVEYSQDYADFPDYHKDDHILITTSGNIDMQQFIYGFQGIGTDKVAFAGSIEIGSSQEAIVLNLDAPLFNNVLDSVTLTNNGQNFNIARAFEPEQTQISGTNNKLPLLAKKVEHDYNGTPAEWNISVVSPSTGTDLTLRDFGGFIGKLDQDAELTVNVTMNTTATDSGDITVAGASGSDIGLVCGSMSDNSILNFSLNGSRKISSVTTEYGHAGGLVGSMGSGSKLIYSGTSILNNNFDIKTTYENGYAGGIAGYNEGGAVIISLPSGTSSYPITQHIEGKEGAGGVYGYFKPGESETGDNDVDTHNSTINISNFGINCQVNGTGYDGGLFGVLDTENDYTILGNSLTSSHSSGNAIGYGGLIGRYNCSDLTKKLEIGAVTANSSNGSASYYGGAIAVIAEDFTEEGEANGGSAYVKFSGLAANAGGADALTFGGLAANADNAFLDANNVTISVGGDHKFQGGAVVGRIKSGVLRMSGTTDLTNTEADLMSCDGGQIVGYRDNALIFGTDNWVLKRGTSVSVDDIGSWGEVIRFDQKTETEENDVVTSTAYGFDDSDDGTDDTVVTVNETEHYAVVSAPAYDENDSSIIQVGSVCEFAKAALNMQINESGNNYDGVLWFDETSNTSSSLLGMNIKLGDDIVLSGTGISSFTRDNARTDSLEAEKCVYTGTFDGDGHSITLAIGEPYGYRGNTEVTDHSVNGNGKIYNHKYNGLFGITNTSSGSTTAQNATLKGTIDVSSTKISDKDIRIAYVGAVSGRAKGYFSVNNITMTDAVTNDVHETVFSAYGSGKNYNGGLLGQASDEIDDISITNCNIKCNIQTSNTNEDSCFGGIIGCISYTGNNSKSWSFEDVTVSGEINNTHARATNKLGGLVAAIAETTGQSNRALDLTSVKADGLTVKSVGSGDSTMGGILGYTWLNVNTTFHNVETANSTVNMTTGNGALGGLVYQGTGYWIVEPCSVTVTDENTGDSTTTYHSGIKIDGLTVTNSNARSFGGILHSTMTTNTALYLEILADDTTNSVKSYNIASANFTGLKNGCVFDEIVAYTASKDTGSNGHAVVSIHSDDFSTEGGSTASGTYQAQTARGAVPNPNTRYYYNLDTIRTATGASDLLMRWALHNYAHSSIQGYFTYGTGFSDNTIPVGTYNMQNYSWYPVDISGTVTVNGTFTFYNKEFEESEQVKANSETYSYKRTSLYDNTNDQSTQHNLMHCGLFRNVTGGITIDTSGISLQGNVGRYGKTNSKASGALVCGTIKGNSTSNIANFTSNGNINLSGIYVHDHGSDSYAPLLINKIGEFSTIVIKNVKAESGKYRDDFKAASSLIGDVGSASATNINLTFADIQLDGRTSSGAYSLDSVYNTKSSLFYRATLLNTFRYSSGSATYDFNIGDDWKTSGDTYTRTGAKGVTYGSEIDDANSQHLGKEYWYKDTNGGIYTNYNTPGASGSGAPSPAISFAGFIPYVYDKCTAATIDTATDKKYQIRVNWAETQMTGCGTYNDPYILTSADDFDRIAELLNGATAYSVALPNAASATALKQTKWDSTGHSDFTWNGSKFSNGSTTYDKVVVQNYLAGAYYKIEENKNIVLNSGFIGFGNTSEEQAIFRGVIVGNGETITLTGQNPLIFASNGSVVKNINVSINVTQISLDQTSSQKISSSHKTNASAKTYGAVMGRILGGDNIIDAVTVNYGSSKIKFTSNNAWNQTVPVGGYVGVIEKGTLIFKGMENGTVGSNSYLRETNAIVGLKDDTVVDSSNNPCLYTTDENGEKNEYLKWLYVNPIVGRVINAAVFTEGKAYRPFEDGTRDGVYIKTSESEADPVNISDYRSVAVDTTYEKYSQPVTMQNGTKNYSIADITPELPMFTTGVPERSSSFVGSEDFRKYLVVDIGLPNAQSLYVMSLVTQSGLGAKNYLERNKRGTTTADNRFYPNYYNLPIGGFYNTGSWGIAPYYKFRSTHIAEYTYVGKCGGGNISEPSQDKAWYEDYNKAKTENAQYNRTGATNSENNYAREHCVDVLPYLIKYYTPKIPIVTEDVTPNQFDTSYFSNIKNKELGYIAFCITHQYTYINLEFTGDAVSYYMPDGFRGLGTFGYQNTNNADNQFSEVYQDLTIHLFGIEGNNNIIDLNMKYYCYYNYDPYAITNVSPGFGFINAMMQNKTFADASIDPDNENYQIRNFTITGSVNSEVINISTGLKYNYNKDINSGRYWAVGGLAGNVVYSRNPGDTTSGGDIYKLSISSISLSNLKVNGVNSTGGVLGYNKSANHADSKTTIRNITTSDLEVSSGLYSGGLIGYSTDTAVEISNVAIAEPNIKSNLNFAGGSYDSNATGGIIGYAATNTNNGPVYLHDITIGTKTPADDYSAYIGYNTAITTSTASNETVRVGGLIGQTAANSSTMINSTGDDHIDYNTKIEKCDVYNVDIYGHKSGGIVGSSENNTVYLGIFDTVVSSGQKNDEHKIKGANVKTDLGTGGIAGFINAGNFVVNNCLIDGYTIQSIQRTGGVVGYTQATKTEIDNTEIKGVSFVSNSSVGGLVGYLNNPLNGYNIRTDDIEFSSFSSGYSYYDGTATSGGSKKGQRGHIIGFNNSKIVKIAGFSRNNLTLSHDCGAYRTVGNYKDDTDTTAARYGSNGYVIFADYYNFTNKNTAITSTKASTVNDINNVAQPTYKIDTQSDNTPNNFPYVTVSPSQALENGADGRFLTGDAVISLTYPNSMFAKILEEKTANNIGAYTNFKSTNLNSPSNSIVWSDSLADAVRTQFSTSAQQVPGSGARNIPLLVIEDTDYKAVTQMLNSYINVLANTSGYNYASDYTADSSNTKYRISLNKCTYDKSTGLYTIGEDGTACLKKQNIGNQWYFRMTAANVDNEVDGVLQFSLLDVQFLDPSDSSKTAYHLYIPVYVKKLLQYDFKAAMISNTDYYADAYSSLNGNSVFENLGNPVTMKFEYIYSRTADEWKDAINGGENVLTNIYKSLNVSRGAWPSGTRMVLVDANNKDKAYYLEPTTSNGTLSLYDFTTKSGEHFKPAPLLNLMNVTVGQPTSGDKNLTPVTVNTEKSESEQFEEALEKGAIVYYNGTYYRTVTDDDTDLEDSDKWAVTAVDTTIQPERYYLSIFTPKSDDTTIYHYQFTGPDSLPQRSSSDIYDGYRPNHITNTNAVVHLFIGDLYETTFTMRVDSHNGEREMSKSNKKLKVTMESTIQLKSVASEVEGKEPTDPDYDKTRKGIAQNMRANSGTSEIYQAFLSTYDRVDTLGGSSNISINMQAPPFVIINKYNYYNGTDNSGSPNPLSYPDPNEHITENYVQLLNNKNIVSNLGNENNSYAITYEMEYELNYFDENDLPLQFSLNSSDNKDEGIGTKVIGFSNISSSKSNIAYSVTSAKDDTTSLRYYVTDSAQAILTYNVVKTSGEMLGPYSDLGINPLDTEETEHLIRTTAVYDAHNLKNSGDYIEFSVKLSNKSNYSEYLSLSTYIKELKIFGTSNDEIFNSSWADGSTHLNGHVKVTKTDNEYKIRVHKDYVQKQGNANSGRYLFPITFTVYTGDSKFNNNRDGENNLTGLMYSNYRVTVHAEMWSALTGGTESDPSNADSFLIYTNARIEPNVIK